MTNKKWGAQDIPEQNGKTIIITGATSGLGKEATKVLAMKNAKVVMAVRNTNKAENVANEIRNEYPNALLDIRSLDLGNLDSIHSFSKGIIADYKNIDILINNAGVMMTPYSKTKDGFEIQMGTNHLGHFALTGLLMPILLSTKNSRLVATSSVAHKQGDIDFTDINWETRAYQTNKAYADSKLANLYFIYELTRKYEGNKNSPMFTVAHPGGTNTELGKHMNGITRLLFRLITQKVEMGTLPTLRAATDVNAQSSDYFGPKNFFEMNGSPVKVKANKMAQNETKAKKLWDISEELTGIKY
jgi:NAD(P)-dependent dehydrogenase (short-subunit alcohol dehydrogenase family)